MRNTLGTHYIFFEIGRSGSFRDKCLGSQKPTFSVRIRNTLGTHQEHIAFFSVSKASLQCLDRHVTCKYCLYGPVTISCGPVFSVSQASLSTCEKFCLFFIVLFFGKQKQKKTIKKKAVFQLVRSSALRDLTGTIVLFFFFIASRDLAGTYRVTPC